MIVCYASPKPCDSPFVRVGDSVAVATVPGIVEVMKLMSNIEAQFSGSNSEILVDNEQVVEYGQPLLACKELGIRSVLDYSEAGPNSLPVKLADQAVCIGPSQAESRCRDARAVIGSAMAFKADAIPRLRLPRRNADFAGMCEAEGSASSAPAPTLSAG